jgi:long-subunit fatty acid transport protein
MRKYIHRILVLAMLMVLGALSAHAGGLWLYEEATPDMGVGGAGRQAAGFDASTASGNPAAMTRLDRSQMEGGFLGLYVDSHFDVETPHTETMAGATPGILARPGICITCTA